MSFKTGGEAEKKGNRYEDNIFVYYLSMLLADKYLGVQSESYDKEMEQGGDIYLKDKEGKIIAVQAKSRNCNQNGWTIHDLVSKDIIKNACKHICEGRYFCFISPLPCVFLKDLCSRARVYNDYNDFYKNELTKGNKTNLAQLEEEIKRFIGDKSVLDFYKHFSMKEIPDDMEYILGQIKANARVVDEEKAFSLLNHYAVNKEKLSQWIYAGELYQYLESNEICFYSVNKENATKKLLNIQLEFKSCLQRKLINNNEYRRKELDTLIDRIQSQKVVIVNGRAGTGKSGVIYQLCKHFDANGFLYLPISLDSYLPEGNTFKFGELLGFSASPVNILSELSDNRTCYLIIDQVDAIRWNLCNATSAFSVCCELVKEISRLENSNIKIIFVCRTIDADKILRFWEKDSPELSKCSVEVNLLSSEEVGKIIGNSRYQQITPKVREMLKNINNLKMYMTLSDTKHIEKSSDIVREYVNNKHSEITRKGFPAKDVKSLHKTIIDDMRRNNAMQISISKLEDLYSCELIIEFCSAGIIEKIDSQIKFTHQSILDYYLAQELNDQVKKCSDIIKVLKKYNGSEIENYEAIKQFFELKQTDEINFVKMLEKILFCNHIRSFIRHIALEALRTIDYGKNDANDVFYKVINSKKYGLKFLYYLTSDNLSFAKAFIISNQFKALINSTKREGKISAFNVIFCIENKERSAYEKIKDLCIEKISDKDIIYYAIDSIDDWQSSDQLFDLKIELLGKYPEKIDYLDWNKLIEYNPNRAGKYIKHILQFDSKERIDISRDKNDKKIGEIIKKNYAEYLGLSYKYLVKNCDDYELRFNISTSSFDGNKKFAGIVFSEAIKYAKPKEIMDIIDLDQRFFKHSALRALLHCDKNDAISILQSLINDNYLHKQNFIEDRGQLDIIKQVLLTYSEMLGDEKLIDLVQQIKEYISPKRLWLAQERFKQRKNGIYCNFFEEEQKILLDSLPYERLNTSDRQYLAYLKRKFPKPEYYNGISEFEVGECRSVVCGIAKKWQKFSEKTWKEIICNVKTGKRERFSDEIDGDGNYVEYDRDSFCRIISMAANIKQKMFVHLVLNISGIAEDFINAICSGLYENSEETKKKYQINNDIELDLSNEEERLEVFKKYFNINNKSYLHSFVWFVGRNNIMDDWVITKLIEIATNSNKYENEIMNVWSGDWDKKLETLTINDLETEKINRVQTCAITAIADTLFETKQLNDDLINILDRCISADHPVLLLSAIDIIYPVWNFDKDCTVKEFVKIITKDKRVMLSHKALRLLDLTVKDYGNLYKETFKELAMSEIKGAENLRERLVYYYCYYGVFDDLVDYICKMHSEEAIRCCISIIKKNSGEIMFKAKRLLLSVPLDEKDCNKRANLQYHIFDDDLMNNDQDNKIVLRFLKKLKITNDSDIYALVTELEKNYNLLKKADIIFAMSNIIIKQSNFRSYYADKVIAIIIKLYSEAKEVKKKNVVRKCLNMIDRFYDCFVVTTIKAVEDIEKMN